MPRLLQHNIKFDFRLLSQDDIDSYSEDGLVKFPAMLIPGGEPPTSGFNSITQRLLAMDSDKRQRASQKEQNETDTSNDEFMKNFMMSNIGVKLDAKGKHVIPAETDDGEQEQKRIDAKMQEEMSRRNLVKDAPSNHINNRVNTQQESATTTPAPFVQQTRAKMGSVINEDDMAMLMFNNMNTSV
jgi:hypothetical protein